MRISKLTHTDTHPYISITLPEGFRPYQQELKLCLEFTYNSTVDIDLGLRYNRLPITGHKMQVLYTNIA